MANVSTNILGEEYFDYDTNTKIHVVINDDYEPLFNALDCTRALEYSDSKQAIRKHIPDEYKISHKYFNYIQGNGTNAHPHSIYITESGFYMLLFNSETLKAKEFKKWVVEKVLPTIRKYGFYKLNKIHDQEMNNLRLNLTNLTQKLQFENEKIKEKNNELNKDKTLLEKEILIVKETLDNIKTDYYKLKKMSDKLQYPDEGVCYARFVENHPFEKNKIRFRLGRTNTLTARMNVYKTHTFTQNDIIAMRKTDDPFLLEKCLKLYLKKYQVVKNRDFYECTYKQLMDVFDTKCFDCMEYNSE